MVAEALLNDGVYRNQFETLISNGGLGAVREAFEERLFAGAYSSPSMPPWERPRYGGLDLVRHPDGPCPRFGSCHFRLRRETLSRCTFSFGDSVTEPTAVATIEVFEPVLASLLDVAAAGGHTSVIAACGTLLGLETPTIAMIVDLLVHGPRASRLPGRALDDYIEAQIHGPVRLGEDVEALVADPSFRNCAVGAQLEEMAGRFAFHLSWHQGFELNADEVPADFRGPEVRSLAARIASDLGQGDNRINAELIGRAARRAVTDPQLFADHAEPAATLQHLKQLWHVLVAYGRPAS